jgi:hypothetical protein
MRRIALIFFLGLCALAHAGTVDPESEVFVQKGRYVTVTLMAGNPIKIFVAGKERAALSDSELKLEASSGNEQLKLSRSGEYYVIDKPPEFSSTPRIIEVRTRLNRTKKSENFRFKLGNP